MARHTRASVDTLKGGGGGGGYCTCPGMIHGWPLATDTRESMDILPWVLVRG